jgi:hypothetical protein
MFKFFFFKKKRKENENNNTPLLMTKLDRIIELLEQQQQEKGNSGNNIHIDHVQIDRLENIVFRLDNIEIDELSGKLIIGNNINATEDLAKPLIQKINKENAKKEAMSETTSSDQTNIEKTSKGYRFRNEF